MLSFVLEEEKDNVHIHTLVFSKTNTKDKPENNELGVSGRMGWKGESAVALF